MQQLIVVCGVLLFASLTISFAAPEGKQLFLPHEQALNTIVPHPQASPYKLFAIQPSLEQKEGSFEPKPIVITPLMKPTAFDRPQTSDKYQLSSPLNPLWQLLAAQSWETPSLSIKNPFNLPYNLFQTQIPFIPAKPLEFPYKNQLSLPHNPLYGNLQYVSTQPTNRPHYYMPRPEQYQNLRPDPPGQNIPITQMSYPLISIPNSPQNNGYPSFIIINPGTFSPYFNGYPSVQKPNVTDWQSPIKQPISNSGYRSFMNSIMAEQQAIKDLDNDQSESEPLTANGEPLFTSVTSPDLTDETSLEDDTGEARSAVSKSMLHELVQKVSQHKQLREGLAAIYLSNFNMHNQ